MDKLIQRLEARIKRSLDLDDQVVYNLTRALEALETTKTLRERRASDANAALYASRRPPGP